MGGSIIEDWNVSKPREIFDPTDKKPATWEDESNMDDPSDRKPESWSDEKRIVDPDVIKPDEWDEDEDGKWVWPMKDNPDYRGPWHPRRIANPLWQGLWEPRKIPNPEFKENNEIYKYDDFGFLGFDLWQVKGGTIFDNVIVTDDKAEADNFVKKWKELSDVEKEKKAAE